MSDFDRIRKKYIYIFFYWLIKLKKNTKNLDLRRNRKAIYNNVSAHFLIVTAAIGRKFSEKSGTSKKYISNSKIEKKFNFHGNKKSKREVLLFSGVFRIDEIVFTILYDFPVSSALLKKVSHKGCQIQMIINIRNKNDLLMQFLHR